MSYQPNPELDQRVGALGEDARVLDVGGWYAPYPLATHVVDIMPYETRAQGYFPEPRHGERFSRESWIQADITEPDFRLSYPDDYFDFAVCMHTVEDLHEVRPLLRELSRVARQGYIETPSRMMEQTIGVSDRACSQVGFNHHKWIVDVEDGRLVLHDKSESFFQPLSHYAIPLSLYEVSTAANIVSYYWSGTLDFEYCRDWRVSRDRAREFRQQLEVAPIEVTRDRLLRLGRRIRATLRGQSRFDTA